MRILVLGCKEYPAFTTDWVHSGGMEVYTERMVRSLSSRARFALYTAAGASDADARVISLGGRVRSPERYWSYLAGSIRAPTLLPRASTRPPRGAVHGSCSVPK